ADRERLAEPEHRVVPATAGRRNRLAGQVRMLLGEQRPHEGLVDVDLGGRYRVHACGRASEPEHSGSLRVAQSYRHRAASESPPGDRTALARTATCSAIVAMTAQRNVPLKLSAMR